MVIEVRDQHTAEQLLILQKNLRDSVDHVKIEVKACPLPASLEGEEKNYKL